MFVGFVVMGLTAKTWLLFMLRECDAEPFCVCVGFAVMSLTAKTWLLFMLRVCDAEPFYVFVGFAVMSLTAKTWLLFMLHMYIWMVYSHVVPHRFCGGTFAEKGGQSTRATHINGSHWFGRASNAFRAKGGLLLFFSPCCAVHLKGMAGWLLALLTHTHNTHIHTHTTHTQTHTHTYIHTHTHTYTHITHTTHNTNKHTHKHLTHTHTQLTAADHHTGTSAAAPSELAHQNHHHLHLNGSSSTTNSELAHGPAHRRGRSRSESSGTYDTEESGSLSNGNSCRPPRQYHLSMGDSKLARAAGVGVYVCVWLCVWLCVCDCVCVCMCVCVVVCVHVCVWCVCMVVCVCRKRCCALEMAVTCSGLHVSACGRGGQQAGTLRLNLRPGL